MFLQKLCFLLLMFIVYKSVYGVYSIEYSLFLLFKKFHYEIKILLFHFGVSTAHDVQDLLVDLCSKNHGSLMAVLREQMGYEKGNSG